MTEPAMRSAVSVEGDVALDQGGCGPLFPGSDECDCQLACLSQERESSLVQRVMDWSALASLDCSVCCSDEERSAHGGHLAYGAGAALVPENGDEELEIARVWDRSWAARGNHVVVLGKGRGLGEQLGRGVVNLVDRLHVVVERHVCLKVDGQ